MPNKDSPHDLNQERLPSTGSAADPLHSSDIDSTQRSERMHVAVRARPIPASSSASCWDIDPAAGTITQNANAAIAKRKQAGLVPAAVRSSNDWDTLSMRGGPESRVTTPSSRSTVFKFDTVLDDAAQTEEAYGRCIQSMVQSALQGVNATILAYGGLLIPSCTCEDKVIVLVQHTAGSPVHLLPICNCRETVKCFKTSQTKHVTALHDSL